MTKSFCPSCYKKAVCRPEHTYTPILFSDSYMPGTENLVVVAGHIKYLDVLMHILFLLMFTVYKDQEPFEIENYRISFLYER